MNLDVEISQIKSRLNSGNYGSVDRQYWEDRLLKLEMYKAEEERKQQINNFYHR